MFSQALVVLAASSLGAAAAAQGPTEAPEQPPITVTGEKIPADEKMVCKQTTTGTMIRKRICMTEDQWSTAQTNSEDQLKSLREWQRVRCSFGTKC